ncbi:MAG TPA: response regulator transcription factor [Beutenbergiaceae bacterium]|nr:response regulator transcription factor [Beutenbergiaceae bacterium]
MTPATRVLVVDDEPYLADLVATALHYEGYESRTARTGRQAVQEVRTRHPHLVILDVRLPDISGIDTCHRLRREGYRLPVLFLSAKGAVADRLAGLQVGGDDYITKPFSLDEVVARVAAVLRRTSPLTDQRASLTYSDLEIDEQGRQVRRRGQLVDLSPTEFRLLRYLTINAGTVLTKDQILAHVWDYDFCGDHRIVATYISYLRRKLGSPELIQTIQRVGYVLRLAESPLSSR